MQGNLRLQIGNRENTLCLDYELDVEEVQGGMWLTDSETNDRAVVWDVELQAATEIGGGPTPLTAILVSELINQKFCPAN